MKTKKIINVVSDGTPLGTHLVLDDGSHLVGCTRLDIYVKPDDWAQLTLYTSNVPFKIDGIVDVVKIHCTFCDTEHEHECSHFYAKNIPSEEDRP